jgi:hypothetical protein
VKREEREEGEERVHREEREEEERPTSKKSAPGMTVRSICANSCSSVIKFGTFDSSPEVMFDGEIPVGAAEGRPSIALGVGSSKDINLRS